MASFQFKESSPAFFSFGRNRSVRRIAIPPMPRPMATVVVPKRYRLINPCANAPIIRAGMVVSDKRISPFKPTKPSDFLNVSIEKISLYKEILPRVLRRAG